jgi:hypothetical protein
LYELAHSLGFTRTIMRTKPHSTRDTCAATDHDVDRSLQHQHTNPIALSITAGTHARLGTSLDRSASLEDFEILVVFKGEDVTQRETIRSFHSYLKDDLLLNSHFQDIITFGGDREDGAPSINLKLLDSVMPSPPPSCEVWLDPTCTPLSSRAPKSDAAASATTFSSANLRQQQYSTSTDVQLPVVAPHSDSSVPHLPPNGTPRASTASEKGMQSGTDSTMPAAQQLLSPATLMHGLMSMDYSPVTEPESHTVASHRSAGGTQTREPLAGSLSYSAALPQSWSAAKMSVNS